MCLAQKKKEGVMYIFSSVDVLYKGFEMRWKFEMELITSGAYSSATEHFRSAVNTMLLHYVYRGSDMMSRVM